jgi:DNA repair exonuclease SbcCD ATPase subunit
MSAEKVLEETAGSGEGPRSPSGSAENVERIREILFGPQIREFGQRLSRIEERLSKETDELKAEVRRRLDSLEAYTRQEVSDLGERLRTERSERTESGTRLSQALADSMKSLERRLTESDERMANALRELRQATFDRIKSVLDDLAEQIGKLEASQNRHLEEVRDRSIDRFEFAGLLTELALRVRGEFGVDGLGESDGDPNS